MKLLSAPQMKEVDRACAEKCNVPTLCLMNHAGEKTAILAKQKMEENGQSLAIAVCGKGNNGGDGLAAALYLKRMGVNAIALFLSPIEKIKGDPATILIMARDENVPIEALDGPKSLSAFFRNIKDKTLVIDAIFGTGFHPPAKDPWNAAIDAINNAGHDVLSIDLPSALDADRGVLEGPSVMATWTITLGAPKPSLFVFPSAARAGKVVVADIGHPADLIENEKHRSILLEAGWCRSTLVGRKPDTHKGTYGHVLVVAGSASMPGAALLTALGAVRSGSGLVTLAVPGELSRFIPPALPEAMPVALPEADGALADVSADIILSLAENKKALVIGPGLSRGKGVAATVIKLLERCRLPIVLDADAINAVAGDPQPLKDRKYPTIITPHPGELARLTQKSVENVQTDRIRECLDASDKFGVITVLKGAGTIIAEPDGNFMVNVSGNPGMAAGGMGDILAGMIGGWISQGLSNTQAACMGVYLHGLAGDIAASEIGPSGFTARELADRVPAAVGVISEGYDDIETI